MHTHTYIHTHTHTHTHFSIDPNITVQLSDKGTQPTPGLSYLLTCNIFCNGADGFNFTYTWMKGAVLLSETGSSLSFSSLRLSDAGPYMCEVTASSWYHSESTTSQSNILNVTMKCNNTSYILYCNLTCEILEFPIIQFQIQMCPLLATSLPTMVQCST